MTLRRAATRAAITSAVGVIAVLAPRAARAQAAPQACVPGQQFACGCAGGASSTQKCNAAGTALEPCQCGPAAATSVAPPPPPPPPPPAPGTQPCPSNQVAPDGTCMVSPDAASAPPPPPPPPPAVVVAAQPTPTPAKDEGPKKGGGPNTGLLAGGLAMFGVGYVGTIGINYGVCASSNSWRGCDSKELSFIPIAGSFILGATENTELSYRVLAFTLGLAQAGGVVLFGLSFAGSGGDQAKTAYVLPTVNRDGGGATLVGRF